MKIQYPGVAQSIDSDFMNFQRLVNVLNIFPRGLYLNDLIENTRSELHEECNYLIEAEKQ